MASSPRSPDPQTVMCHECEGEWYRQEHGLICPECRSEFVEILEDIPRQDDLQQQDYIRHRQSPMPDGFQNTGPAQNITFTNSPFGEYSISGTFVTGSPQPTQGQDFTNTFMQMLASMVQGPMQPPPAHQHLMNAIFGMGQPQQDPQNNPSQNYVRVDDTNVFANIIGSMLGGSPAGNMGDYLHTQEEFDRLLSEIMEQHQSSSAAPPASEEIIASLPRLPLTKDMLGDGTGHEAATKGECSICMDEVAVGNEVAILPCDHWFHMECIRVWLQEHDTCPHCRKSVEEGSREAAHRREEQSGQSPVRGMFANLFRRR